MQRLLVNLVKAATLLAGAPAFALLTYDVVAVRPKLHVVEGIVSTANPRDAAPPALIRKLIDASAGSPNAHATRMVTARIYAFSTQGQQHVRNALWGILLPLHVGEAKMYGLYATLVFNGHDLGLSSVAARQFGKELQQLSPFEAAQVVALTQAPSILLRDRERWAKRARAVLARCGCACATEPATWP